MPLEPPISAVEFSLLLAVECLEVLGQIDDLVFEKSSCFCLRLDNCCFVCVCFTPIMPSLMFSIPGCSGSPAVCKCPWCAGPLPQSCQCAEQGGVCPAALEASSSRAAEVRLRPSRCPQLIENQIQGNWKATMQTTGKDWFFLGFVLMPCWFHQLLLENSKPETKMCLKFFPC